ncbi:hypothetical protein IWQ56_005104 [Coemansia nantahalensis]|uniref:Uncharacterized protein n=1 Tax=Coemansia helicoidea TaxID=1286919 RepID=A0ACC1L1B1_9FUNG|nr:hypothetical protein IWQ56_005104 [Coemansia nantahalensis]KAJ2798877.1 hypothetical protein H4R21_003756 [Coemansia helicoidea]
MAAPTSAAPRAQGAYIAQPARAGAAAPPALAANHRGTAGLRIANVLKLGVFGWLARWILRFYEIDRSLRNEPGTPRISTAWLGLAFCSLLPFVFVYLYASIWRRRVLGEPLDLQDWQAGSNPLVHAATIGLLLAWAFAIIALFPGYGMSSVLIVAVMTICAVAMADAAEGVFS